MLIAEECVSIGSPEGTRLAFAVRVRAVVPDAAADAELVPAFSPAAGNDARVRCLAQPVPSFCDVTNAPGQPPCSSMTSSISCISRIVSESATTIFW